MTQNLRLKSIFVFFLGGSSFGWKDAARHAAKPAAPWRPLLSMWSSCAVNICRRHINKSLRKTHQGGIFRARYTESDCDTELQGHTNRKQTRSMLCTWLLSWIMCCSIPSNAGMRGLERTAGPYLASGMQSLSEHLRRRCCHSVYPSRFVSVFLILQLMWKCQNQSDNPVNKKTNKNQNNYFCSNRGLSVKN